MLGTKLRFTGREEGSLNNEVIYQVSTHTMSSNRKMKIFCQQSQPVGNVSPAYSNAPYVMALSYQKEGMGFVTGERQPKLPGYPLRLVIVFTLCAMHMTCGALFQHIV